MEPNTQTGHKEQPEVHHPLVTVLYNGLSREIEFLPTDLVEVIRQRAIAAFGITQNPHILSLWTEAGVELSDNETAHAAGAHNRDRLLLRPGAVKGGGR
jgi:hypothetical protein